MSHHRFARLALMLAAFGLNAAPVLMHSASAQNKDAAPAAAPAAQAPAADSVRPELFKLLDPKAFKPLIDAKNFTEAQSRITQAEAIPNRTPYENYVLNRMKLSLASASNNDQLALSALEAIVASGKVPAAEVPTYQAALGNYYYNAKNYPKAIEALKQAQAGGNTSESVNAALVRAYYLSGDYASALKAQQPVLDAAEKAGKVPSQEDLRLYATAANKAKNDAAYLKALELLAANYPTDDYWTDLISRGVVRKPGFAEANFLDVLRLQHAAIKKMSPEAYTEMAEQLLHDGFPTEAKKIVDAGFAAGVLSGAKATDLRARANKQAADDAKTIASGETNAAKSGTGLVNLGWAYVTMDQFDKGIGFIERGIAKGGLKSPDAAKLRLGVAYARAGQKDKAIQTFQTVKAGGGLSDIAKYWILLVNHPNQGGTAEAK
jgi:tetratricopeptide (TPR) repeat protein